MHLGDIGVIQSLPLYPCSDHLNLMLRCVSAREASHGCTNEELVDHRNDAKHYINGCIWSIWLEESESAPGSPILQIRMRMQHPAACWVLLQGRRHCM